jgi:hypothetical protein
VLRVTPKAGHSLDAHARCDDAEQSSQTYLGDPL